MPVTSVTDTALLHPEGHLPSVDPWWEQAYPAHPDIWPIYTDFKVFLRLTWEHLGLPEPTPIQLDIADYLQHGVKRRIIMGFRGVGKSYVTSAFVCWLLLRDPDLCIMVVSASKIRADDFSTFTKRLISEMGILQHLQAKTGQRDSNVAFDVGPAKAKHSPSVKSVGITGQLSGSRADVIIADDVEVPGNSATQDQRDKLSESVKEFDAVLKPAGHVIYLGTPQTEQSLYNRLGERGYEIRIWPSEIPNDKYIERMGYKLAPFVLDVAIPRHGLKTSLDPKRFTDIDLAERKLSYGSAGYALQFLLDTSLSDAERYPLKLKDLIVYPLDRARAPSSFAWGPKGNLKYSDLFTPGLDGDAFFRPPYVDSTFLPYTGSVMAIDPSGRGKDETAWAVTKMLNATVFLTLCKGKQGGYEDTILREIATDAKNQGVNLILVEENFGQGMFAKLLIPHLRAVGHMCAVESVRSTVQKEKRIIDTLEPIMTQHRLVVCENAIRLDDDLVKSYGTPDKSLKYRLFYQMTRITKDKGALAHDDRLDAVAEAVGYWVDAMAQDAKSAAEKAKEKDLMKEIKQHLKDQVFTGIDPRTNSSFKSKGNNPMKRSLGGMTIRGKTNDNSNNSRPV